MAIRLNIFTRMPVPETVPESPCTYVLGNYCMHQVCYEADMRERMTVFGESYLAVALNTTLGGPR
jgi:hypothetical protein